MPLATTVVAATAPNTAKSFARSPMRDHKLGLEFVFGDVPEVLPLIAQNRAACGQNKGRKKSAASLVMPRSNKK